MENGKLNHLKYFNFFIDSFATLFGIKNTGTLNILLPVGISFYTFQALGYFFDIARGRINVENSLVDYILFICFFPQIFSGPISKANEILPQIKSARKFDYKQSTEGLKLLLWGMFLKLVLADRLGLYVDKVVANYEMYNGGTCALAAIFYSFQIYGDFAGYSFMAVGISKTLGFDLISNFNRPYFSTSITDFWR